MRFPLIVSWSGLPRNKTAALTVSLAEAGTTRRSRVEEDETMEQKRIMRSRKERMIGGVCGGVAEHFNVDATLVRLIFVLITLVDGIGLLAYLVLWLVMPEAPLAESAAAGPAASADPAGGAQAAPEEAEAVVDESTGEEEEAAGEDAVDA